MDDKENVIARIQRSAQKIGTSIWNTYMNLRDSLSHAKDRARRDYPNSYMLGKHGGKLVTGGSAGIFFGCSDQPVGPKNGNNSPPKAIWNVDTEPLSNGHVHATFKDQSTDPDGKNDLNKWEIDYENDGKTDTTLTSPGWKIEHEYVNDHTAKLKVTDKSGASDQNTTKITGTKQPPQFKQPPIQKNYTEDIRKTIPLEKIVKNANQVTVEKNQGVVDVAVKNDTLTLKPQEDATGIYSALLKATNQVGSKEAKIKGKGKPQTDIRGKIKDSTGNLESIIEAYKNGKKKQTIRTEPNGNFNEQLKQELQGKKITIKVKSPDSYTRTIDEIQTPPDGTDMRNVKILKFSYKPFQDLGLTPKEGKKFAKQIAYDGVGQGGGEGYRAWNPEVTNNTNHPTGVILPIDPITQDTLTQDNIDLIKQARNELERCTGETFPLIVEEPGDFSKVRYQRGREAPDGKRGYIAISRNSNESFTIGVGLSEDNDEKKGTVESGNLIIRGDTNLSINMPGLRSDFLQGVYALAEADSMFTKGSILAGGADFKSYDCQLVPYIKQTVGNPLDGNIEPMEPTDHTYGIEK